MQIISPTRREASKLILATMGSTVLPFLKGCNSVSGGGGVSGGIEIIENPEDVLNNSNMQGLIRTVENEGYSLNLSRSLNPPYLEGTYNISGSRIYPVTGPLAPGTFRWSNQTSDNKISTDYSQLTGQSGISKYGEIIRGEGSAFTIYSRLRYEQNGCGAVNDIIIDGNKYENGDVNSIYLSRIVSVDEGCVAYEGNEIAGILELSLVGNPKRILEESSANLFSLLNSIR